MYFFRDDNNPYPDNGFRFFDDGEPIDEVGEYEVDVDYTYAPLYEPLEDTRDLGDRPTPPPPAANTPPVSGPPPYTPSKSDKSVQSMTKKPSEPGKQQVFPPSPGGPGAPQGPFKKPGFPGFPGFPGGQFAPGEPYQKNVEISPKAVGPGSIRPCLFKYTYIWQTNGVSYWAYITHLDRFSISGWRWRFGRWIYFGVDLRRIDSFVCY